VSGRSDRTGLVVVDTPVDDVDKPVDDVDNPVASTRTVVVVDPRAVVVVDPRAVVVVDPDTAVVVVDPDTAVVVVDPDTAVVVVDPEPCAHVGLVNVSSSRVTAPFRARVRPWTVTPVFTPIEVSARMFPTNVEFVPRVAELPTCQKTLHSWAPLTSETVLSEPVMSVESVWKMNTVFGLPPASRVSVPVRPSADLAGPA